MIGAMDINALREFVAVARAGSFAGGATALGVPKSTVSKRVRDLEAALGTRLIERTTRRLRITAEGAALLPRAERILADADEAERLVGASGTRPEGHLRIRMPVLFAQAFGGRIVAACRAAHAGITLEIVLIDRAVDLMAEGFDGAVAIGPLADSGQAARTLTEIETIPVAAPGLLDGHAAPYRPADLTALPVLVFGRERTTRWRFQGDGGPETVELRGEVAIDALTVLRDAALEGAGIAYLPAFLVEAAIAEGRLVRLLPAWRGVRVPISFVYPSPHAITGRLRAFIDVLVAQFPDRTLPGA